MKNVRLDWRNSFHPVWLIAVAAIVLPALRSLIENDDLTLDLIYIAAGLAVGAGMVWLGLARPSRIPCQLGKELRVQLPAVLIGLAGPVVSRWFRLGSDDIGLPLAGLHILSSAYLGAGALGSEFDSKTILGLLTHPGGRGRIYFQKLFILAISLFVVTVALLAVPTSYSVNKLADEDVRLRTVAIAVLALSSGPFYSIQARGTLAGGIFALVVPPGLLLMGETVLGLLWRYRHPGHWLPSPLPGLDWFLWTAGPLYVATTALASWRAFSRLSVPGDGAGTAAIHTLGRPFDLLFRSFFAGARSGTSALVRKELRLQLLPWLMAGCYLLLAIIMMIAKRCLPDSDIPFDEFQLVMAAGAPYFLLMIGAGTIAEERRLGTLDWQLTFPCSVRKQWCIKVAVALALALVLGIFVPASVVWCAVGHEMRMNLAESAAPIVIGTVVCSALAVVLLGIFASSLSRSAAGAAFLGLGIGLGLIAVIAIFPSIAAHRIDLRTHQLVGQWNAGQFDMTPYFVSTDTLVAVRDYGLAAIAIGMGGFWLATAAVNFRSGIPTQARMVRQLVANGMLALIIGIFASGWMILYFEAAFRGNFQKMAGPRQPVVHRNRIHLPESPK